jgi:Dyp-type peroxidase family
MSVNLNTALEWKKMNAAEYKLLQDLQGNILKGHGREHTQNIFFSVDPGKKDEGIKFIKAVAQHIKSAYQQLIETEQYRQSKQDAGIPFISIFLSEKGYVALGIDRTKIPNDVAFRGGLKSRQEDLSDPKIEDWDPAFQAEIHGMILIGGADETQVRKETAKILSQKPASVTTLGIEHGLAMRNGNGDGIEHFGYVDGRSQPLVLKEDVERERTKNGGIDRWNPEFPLKQVLVPCPGGDSELSYGSYFVFRKLEQNVKGFKEREEEIAKELTRIAEQSGLKKPNQELAGAMIVGRFEDGTPAILDADPKIENDGTKPKQVVPNNFNFDDDTGGKKCPFHSHIRKTNPRGDSVREFGTEFGVSIEDERSHIMARRGITYGTRNAEIDAEGKIIELKDKPVGGVGLLFMAYQCNLERQFEFTQKSWVNSSDFVKPGTGIDPVIGQGSGSSKQQQPVVWGSDKKEPIDFSGFVTMKGGEYFFAPSISFFKHL